MKTTKIELLVLRSVGFALMCFMLVTPVAWAQNGDQKPFTRAELLAYLRTIPHSQNYSSYADMKAAHDKLARLIKIRGVDFVLPMAKFDRDFHQGGASSEVMLAIAEHYRSTETAAPAPPSPTTLTAFAGRWTMGIAGMSTTHRTQGSTVIRTDSGTGARGGFLEIDPNGTYVWKLLPSDPPEKYFRGQWRAASDVGLQSDVSAIFLLKAYEGADWIVTHRRSNGPGEKITVARDDQRFRYHIGSR
jgi:hypothetical protein